MLDTYKVDIKIPADGYLRCLQLIIKHIKQIISWTRTRECL